MRIPKEWQKNLEQHILTEEMYAAALVSISQRARNWKARRKEYSCWKQGKIDYAAKAAAAEKEMSERLQMLLSVLTPVCIVKTFHGFHRARIRQTDPAFALKCGQALLQGRIAYAGGYYHGDPQDDFPSFIPFADIEDLSRPRFQYELCYRMQEKDFRVPLTEAECGRYEQLPVLFMTAVNRESAPAQKDLMSVAFVKKVLAVLKEEDVQLKWTAAESTLPIASGITEAQWMQAYRLQHFENYKMLFLPAVLALLRAKSGQAYEGKEQDPAFLRQLADAMQLDMSAEQLIRLCPDESS